MGFMIAASADMVWRVIELPADKSMIATWPGSQHVMNLSLSSVHEPNLTASALTASGGVVKLSSSVNTIGRFAIILSHTACPG